MLRLPANCSVSWLNPSGMAARTSLQKSLSTIMIW
jgi:hypothetical protein